MAKTETPATRCNVGDLLIDYDPHTGQILRVFDRRLDMQVIAFQRGSELEINRLPLATKLEDIDELDPADPGWQCNLSAVEHPSVGCYEGFDIFRLLVVGSACKPSGNHINPPNSMHLRYRIERKQVNRYATSDPQGAGKRPIKMPLWLDTIGTLAASTDWFGPDTQMMHSCVGGCGPHSHVAHDEGPVRQVVEGLWNAYRCTHPGMQTIPGAAFYHEDGRWLWITCQRPMVGMHWEYQPDAMKAQFQYHAHLDAAEIVHTPEVSMYWGRGGREEMLRQIGQHFIGYEEPGDWWWRTTWFWLHWWQYRQRGFDDMVDHVKFLHDELGLTGFGLTAHDLRPGSWDCTPSSFRPSPHLGGERGLRRLGETIRDFGGKMFVWLGFLGLCQPSDEIRADWPIRGADGRAYESFMHGSQDTYTGLNFDHPEVQAYYLHWIRRYIEEFGVEGIFWDCGGTPIPPDFTPADRRPFQRFPSESMTAGYRFMERVMQLGRACSPDFFMWHETISADLPGTGYSSLSGCDEFLIELDRHMHKRLVYRSCSTYNLYGGFPMVRPGTDTAFASPVTIETYRAMANDPMNQWLVKFVRDHGVRDAVGLGRGVAWCAGHVVVDPGSKPYAFTIPRELGETRSLVNVHSGETVEPVSVNESGSTFQAAGPAAFEAQ